MATCFSFTRFYCVLIYILCIIFLFILTRTLWIPIQISVNRGPLIQNHLSSITNNRFGGVWNTSTISRLIFISCNRQGMLNPFWSIIHTLEPNILLWLGDIVYADHIGTQKEVMKSIILNLLKTPKDTLLALITRKKNLFPPATPTTIQQAYKEANSVMEYQHILSSSNLTYYLGIWDDHDYGVNDGDKTYPYKEESKILLLNFLNVSKTDPRRSIYHQGVYTVHYFDSYPPSTSRGLIPLKCAMILLDTRFNKDPWTVPRDTADFLGEQQWTWLNNIFENSIADVHLIISSIQVVSEKRIVTESWDQFPNARQRLYNLIFQKQVKNPIFLSGDVHFAEIGSVMCHPQEHHSSVSVNKIPLWEMTSSGLTHASGRVPFGLGLFLDVCVRWLLPAYHVTRQNGIKQIWTGRNIGIMDIIWNHFNQTFLSFKILDSKARVRLQQTFLIGGIQNQWLSPIIDETNLTSCFPNKGLNPNISLSTTNWDTIHWTCHPINGPISFTTAYSRLFVTIIIGILLLNCICLLLYYVIRFHYYVLKMY